MADITGDWNKNMPSGSSLRSQGDDLMRQHWASLQSAIEDEHYFTDSPTTAGIHKQGSARIYTGTASQVSSPSDVTNAEGRLMFATDTGDLHLLGGSANTVVSSNSYIYTRRPFVGVLVGPTSDLGVPSQAAPFSKVSFDTERYNVSSVATSGLTMVTIPAGEAGVYQMETALRIASGATKLDQGEYAELQLLVDSFVMATDYHSGVTVDELYAQSVYTLSGGSHVYAQFRQTSGSRWSMDATDPIGRVRLSVNRLD